ncbi:hypothetical protein [Emticicia sp.]|uniref:hypothetical protein n=1 Tax=Emticicia sp. TaxID=1930953 RepID=UPI00374FF40D
MAKKYQSSLGEQKIFQNSTFVQHEDIKNHISIIPELEALIPPLNQDEFEQLEANLLKNGCRESLLVWPTTDNVVASESTSTLPSYVLIDGHNRFKICQKNRIDFSIHLISFKTMEDVREFMIDNQLGRRNLTLEQASYLRGMKYINLKQNKGKYGRDEHNAENEHYGNYEQIIDFESHNAHFEHYDKKKTTAEFLGEKYNVGQATIRRDAEFAQGLEMLEPSLKTAVLAGKTNLTKNKIQQLGKKTVQKTKIANESDVDELIDNKKLVIAKTPNKSDQLIEQLSKQIEKLRGSKNKKSDTCKKIIDLATQLSLVEE